MNSTLRIVPALLLLGVFQGDLPRPAVATWRGDHHMHLGSADLCRRLGECLPQSVGDSAVYGIDAVRALDSGHVGRGVILSCAYLYGYPDLKLPPDSMEKWVRIENDFTASEIAKYPDRLVGFMSVDPLEESAIREMEHWRGSKVLVGLKLHLYANDVDITRPDHLEKLKGVLRQAASQGLPIVIHVGRDSFDSTHAEIFIREVLPSAGTSWVQMAHGAGGGEKATHHLAVLRVFADHFVRHDPTMAQVLFDLSYVPAKDLSDADALQIAAEMRRIGIARFLFASDFNVLTPLVEQEWLTRLHLSAAEMNVIRKNCAPWLCGTR